jgi:hypothetical protein
LLMTRETVVGDKPALFATSTIETDRDDFIYLHDET